jgi:hypothetical protein
MPPQHIHHAPQHARRIVRGALISMAKVNIGLRQAKLLCQLPEKKRLNLIGEGLPVILESARGFWRASEQLADNNPREAEVLGVLPKKKQQRFLSLWTWCVVHQSSLFKG